ncbi:MAG: Gldg family protein [Alphaproteobacteria bacterium]|nr:Gldg family protein [Alphaproteobacteria bacterium]
MKKFFAVVKYELIRYFTSPVAYVYLLSFLILNGSFAIYFGDFFNRGQADLLPMFDFQPWLYLLFIPGISMRLWAEEFRQKTVIQIVTLPVSVPTLVVGKFTAAWIFCGLALLLTFPFWIVVNILGTPDNAVILVGYLASFTLAGCMLAVSETVSALTKNQVIALVIAVIVNLCFFWSGIEYILAFFRLWLPVSVVDTIASFSFLSHFDTLSRGLLELRDVIFFFSFIIFCNATTVLIVNFKTAGHSNWLKSGNTSYVVATWLMFLLAFLGINITANCFTRNVQFDATQEKLFTLTDSTKTVLKNLKEPVLAKLYFSPILAQRNPQLRLKFDNLRILLEKYKSHANGMFDYKIYYPQYLSQEEDVALADGVQPIPLIDLNQNALFGLTIEDTLQNKNAIPFFAQDSQNGMEQDITTKLYQLHHTKKTIGIVGGGSLFGVLGDDNSTMSQTWRIIQLLSETYKVYDLQTAEELEEAKPDVLMLFFPDNLDEKMLAQIEKYSATGKVIAFLDAAHEAARLYAFQQSRLHPSDSTALEDFWKFKFYSDYVIADLENSVTVDSTTNYSTNPVFSQDIIQFKIPHQNMNPYHPVTKNLREMLVASASIVLPDNAALESGAIKFYPLLTAGKIASVMTADVVLDNLNPQEVLKYFQPDDNPKVLAAEIKSTDTQNPFDVIVVGDSDLLYDSFWSEDKYLLESKYTIHIFDNANFLLNAADYLTGDNTLLALRGKRAYDRRFENIEILRRVNSLQYKKAEENIFQAISDSKAALQKVWSKRNFEERENFTVDELTVISEIRQKLNNYLHELSHLRNQAYKDIAAVADRVAFAVIWLVPLLLCLLLLLTKISKLPALLRKISAFRIDKSFVHTGICALSLFAIGVLSAYQVAQSSLDTYENKPAFPQVQKNLNTINKIQLKNHDTALTFVRQSGLWQLQEHPEIPVLQERIRRLLTTTAEATLFVRKSNKAENLATFDLLPLEDKKSTALQMSVEADGKNILTVNLGKTDIDLGRGAKAAYMRFPDQFQVWEIKADFVDMNPDWHAWTYSHVWDLRYGRLYDPKGNPEAEIRLTELMKVMLNTPITAIKEAPQNTPIKSLKLYIEDGNYATLECYKTENEAYIMYRFDKNNSNVHLKTIAPYYTDKAVVIEMPQMEKILELIP